MNNNFLSKKSWHTGSIKHMEKVWKAEQVDLEEKKKMELLKRELAEEERILDLRKMAEQAQGKKVVEKVDWMYSIKKGPTSDEYLLGTAMKQDEEEKELDQLARKPGTLWLHQVNPQQDAASKVRDDPLLAIKQQEKSSLKKILDNPLQMKKIKESKHLQKRIKKLKKQHSKKRSRSRSASPPNKTSPSPPPKRRNSSPPNRRSSPRPNRRNSPPSPKRERRHSPSPKRERRNSPSPKRERKRSLSPKRERRNSPSPKRERKHSISPKREHSPSNRKSYNNGRDHNRRDSKNQKPKMSAEEMKKLREEMQQNAVTHEDHRWKRIKTDKELEEMKAKLNEPKKGQATFLNDMNRGIYITHDDTLEDRIKTHIHSVQRNNGTALIHEEGGLV